MLNSLKGKGKKEEKHEAAHPFSSWWGSECNSSDTHCYILSISNLIWLQSCTVPLIRRLFGRRLLPLRNTPTQPLSSFPVLLSWALAPPLHSGHPSSVKLWERCVRAVCDTRGGKVLTGKPPRHNACVREEFICVCVQSSTSSSL